MSETSMLHRTKSELNELVAVFKRDGFVHVPAVLSPEEVTRHRVAVDAAVANRKRNDPRPLSEKTPYEQSFIQCEYLWEDFPDVRSLAFEPKITSLAAALVQAHRVRIWHDQALYKEPGGRETDAHQDHAYWPIAETDAVTAWLPLVDVGDRDGCMGYIAGTHKAECEYVDIFGSPGSGAALQQKHRAMPTTYVTAKSGDVIFHHASTVHLAKANTSPQMRRVYTCIYFRDGCRRSAAPQRHPSVDRDAIGVGAVIAGGATPIAWPLEDDRLPTPVPWPPMGGRTYMRAVELGVLPPG